MLSRTYENWRIADAATLRLSGDIRALEDCKDQLRKAKKRQGAERCVSSTPLLCVGVVLVLFVSVVVLVLVVVVVMLRMARRSVRVLTRVPWDGQAEDEPEAVVVAAQVSEEDP